MKSISLTILFLFITMALHCQVDKTNKNNYDRRLDSLIYKVEKIQKIINKKQADKSENAVTHSGEVTIKSPDKELSLNDYAPWIVALVIGIMSYIIGRGQISKMNDQIILGRQTLETQKEIAINEKKKNVILSNRQKWVSELRELISDLVSLMQLMDLQLYLAADKEDKEEFILNQHADRVNKLIKYDIQIKLMLNMKEQKHSELIDEIEKYEYTSNSKLSKEKKKEISNNNEKVIKQIITISQEILKEEWERIKRLD